MLWHVLRWTWSGQPTQMKSLTIVRYTNNDEYSGMKLTADVYQYWIVYSWNFGSFSVEREKCTTSVTSGAGTAYPSGTSEFITLSLCPIFCWPLLYYLFFCVRLIITPLISSSFSFIVVYCASTYSNYTILWFTTKLSLNA
jgi:hypothetical protein